MLDRIIRFSLDNRLAVLVVTALVLMWGMSVLLRTQVDIFPDLNAPTVVVMTETPGMAPEEIEATVTYPIETAVNGSAGVRRVRSSSTPGFSVVWVEFDWDTDVNVARQTVAERLGRLEGSLPPGAGVPTLGPQSSILGEIMIIGLTAGDSVQGAVTTPMELRDIADRDMAPRLLSLPGVASVAVLGGDERQYRISLCPARMLSMGVTLGQVRQAVEGINSNASGGVLYDYGNEYLIKGDISTADTLEIANTAIDTGPGGRTVRLGDVASVGIGAAEPRIGAASVEGRPAVLVTVTKQPGAGTIELTGAIDGCLGELARTLPADVKLHTDIFRQSDFIDRSIGNLQESLLIGAVLVVTVLFFFLMNLRTTLISLVALPLSVIVTVIALHLLGLTINTMSLGGIAIAIGSLVDDAIVDVENVHRRLRESRAKGLNPVRVVYEASREVRMPIFNSTLIIAASFLPLFFLQGIEGRLLIPLGLSFVIALGASTLVALTVTPVLCTYLLAGDRGEGAARLGREPWLARRLKDWYGRAVQRVLRRPRPVVWATAALLAVSAGAFVTLGRGFLPPFNEGSLTINVSTLPGVSLEVSDRLGREAERIIMSMPEVRTVARKTGRAELDEHSLGVNVSEIEAPYVLDHGRSRSALVADLRTQLARLPGVNIEIGQPISHRIDAMLSGTEAQVAVKLFGDDLSQLFATGNRIKALMAGVPGVVDVNIEQQMERPQLHITPRRDMLALYGIPMGDFATALRVALGGEKVSQVYDHGRPYDLVLRLEPGARSSVEALGDITVDSPRGKIPLSQVAAITSTAGPGSINRENVSRRIVVSANVEGRDLHGAVSDIRDAIDGGVTLPEGYYVSYGGQFESERSASRTLLLVSLLALVVIFLLLYGQYRNPVQAGIILLNMPLALIGGVLTLRLTGAELNIPAIIGFISLMGIATRNGMLLMSRYDALRSTPGVPLDKAVAAGSADRLNPILMTALSSALALVPIAVNGHMPGNEIQSPMAIVILGGLLSSTLLNMFVVPAVTVIAGKRLGTPRHTSIHGENEEATL